MQVSSDYLRDLLRKYEEVTEKLNAAIDLATKINNELANAKALTAKSKNNKDLIEEQIRCEKQLIQAGR